MYPLNLDHSLEELKEVDALPDGPITSKKNRKRVAFNWYNRKGVPMSEIAQRLGVKERTVDSYVNHLTEEELQAMVQTTAEARAVAASELQDQLREVGRKRRTTETDVKIYTDKHGDLVTEEFRDDNGVKRVIKVPQGIELQPDEEKRFYARKEIREILTMLLDLTGGWEPIEIETETTVNIESVDEDIDSLV